MNHPFNRYTAAGNTFVVMNTWEKPLSLSREAMTTLVQTACDFTTGVGSDGLILINHSGMTGAEFRMDFYNPDGSTGMLCGNGARCAVQAARDYGYAKADRTEFEVLGAVNHADLLATGSIRVYFHDPTVIRPSVELQLDNPKPISTGYVDLGSQHVVVFMDELKKLGETDIETFDIAHYGPLLRWHSAFAPVGVNANFVDVGEDCGVKYLRIRTYERGVEGETLACGTGCMSSAIIAKLTGKISATSIRLLTQSGEFVTVEFALDGERVTRLSLEGPVVRGETGMLLFDENHGDLKVIYD